MLNLDQSLALRALLLSKNTHLLLLGIGIIVVAGTLFGISTFSKNTNAVSITSQEPDTAKLTSANASSADPENIFVDIGGAVEHPGIYKLKSGARIADLLNVSGGVSAETASAAWFLKNINTAKTLFDEQKVYIPFEWEVYESTQSIADLTNFPILTDSNGSIQSLITSQAMAASNSNGTSKTNTADEKTDTSTQIAAKDAAQGVTSTKSSTSGEKINVNTASSVELESLDGVGSVYANRIIQNRPFKSLDELKDKAKLTDSVISKIKDAITF